MDSTACLVWPDAPHVNLPFQFPPVGERDMEQDNPITRHLKFQFSSVMSRLSFFCICEYRTHARVRHVSLDRNVRARDGFAGGVRQLESDRSGADVRRTGRDFVVNLDKRGRPRRSRAAGHE